MDIIVDPKFRDKIPKPSEEERRRLEENILADGIVREPLVVWKDHDVLVDGHNRWDIIQKHPGIPYTTIEMDFDNEWDVIAWICRNQLGRRNISKVMYDKLIQEEHDAVQNSHGGDRRSSEFSSGENFHLKKSEPSTRKVIAEEHGITEGAVKTAVEFGRGLDAADAVVPGFKDEILSGETRANKSYISDMRKMEPEQIKKAVEEIRNPKKVGFPSGLGGNSRKPSKEELEIEASVSRKTDKRAVVEYGMEDLLEELSGLQQDFIDKYHRVLDMHMELLDHPRKVATLMKEFEKEWKEIKERVQ